MTTQQLDRLVVGTNKRLICRSLLRLLTFLWLLPFSLTFGHLWHRHFQIHRSFYQNAVRMTLVAENRGRLRTPLGVFVPQTTSSPLASTTYFQVDFSVSTKRSRESRWLVHVRDLLDQSDLLLKTPRFTERSFALQQGKNQQCLQYEKQLYCRKAGDYRNNANSVGSAESMYGNYYNTNDTETTSFLSLEKMDDSSEQSSWSLTRWFGRRSSSRSNTTTAASFRTNPHKQPAVSSINEPSPLYQAIGLHPATSLLIAFQVLLAYQYWSRRTAVATVAQIYSHIVGQHHGRFEPYRLLTGSTAHFEIWHLGFNMMSLSAVGQQLEGSAYTSVAFLSYNLSFILWTAVVWLGLQRLVLYYYYHYSRQQRQNPSAAATFSSTPTVGYSGVLFAWITIVALEQQVSCPIFFLPDVCFHAWPIGQHHSFNVGPLVQLVFLQVVLPRVSWTGHLAGILAGFAVHWRLIPVLLMHFSVALPLLYYLYLTIIRRLVRPIPLPRKHENEEVDGMVETPAPTTCCSSWSRLHIFVLLLSAYIAGPFSSLTVSYALLVLFSLQQACCRDNDARTVLARAILLVAVLIQVTDAMTAASWAVSSRLSTDESFSTTAMALLWTMVVLRSLVLFSLILFAASRLVNDDAEEGVFYYAFQFCILEPSRQVAGNEFVETLLASFYTWKNVAPVVPVRRADTTIAQPNSCTTGSWSGTGRRLGGDEQESINDRKLSRLL